MTVRRAIKVRCLRSKSVGVIASEDDLARALRLRRVPDFFEFRLDALPPDLTRSHARINSLGAELIITARDPREGGMRKMNARVRARLLRAYLHVASFVDVELHSASAMRDVLEAAEHNSIKRIISVHQFDSAASPRTMEDWLERARNFAPDIFKVAVRTDSRSDLDDLLVFFDRHHRELPIAAMGIGKLGRQSRIELARRGSALNYAHLGRARVDGQLSLADLRRVLRR